MRSTTALSSSYASTTGFGIPLPASSAPGDTAPSAGGTVGTAVSGTVAPGAGTSAVPAAGDGDSVVAAGVVAGSDGAASPLDPPAKTRVKSRNMQAMIRTPTSAAWTTGLLLIDSLIARPPGRAPDTARKMAPACRCRSP